MQLRMRARVLKTRIKRFWKGRINNLSRLKRWQRILALGLIALAGLLGVILVTSKMASSEAPYYQQRLQAISNSINAIEMTITERETLTDPKLLPDYYEHLDTVVEDCSDIIKKARTASSAFKEKAEKSSKLCQDLSSVASYQKNLYNQLEVLLNVNTRKLPRPEEAKAKQAANNINGNISQIQANLKRINRSRFTDPAAGEIDTLLIRLQDQGNKLMAQERMDPAHYNQLLKNIGETQTDLLLRRGYFWRATAEIDVLQKVIKKQISSYGQ